MNVFDKFLIGDLDYIYFDFSGVHLDKRLKENGITLEYIKYLIYNVEPLYFIHSRGNSYAVYYESPQTKDYDEIKLIFACKGNSIDIISIMPNTSIGTFKNQTKFDTEEKKDLRKKTSKAHAKREKMH